MRTLSTTAVLLIFIAFCGITIISANTATSSGPVQPPCSPAVTATSPAINQIGVADSGVISITFGTVMDPSSYNDTTFIVNGSLSGPQFGVVWGDATTLNMTQSHRFAPGEVVTVTATEGILCADGGYLEHGYSWQFTVDVDPSSPGEFRLGSLIPIPVGDTPVSVVAADLDNDGDLDLVTANMGSGNISVLLNVGGGTYSPKLDYYSGAGTSSVVAADLDGDGDLDVTATNAWGIYVSVFMNYGDGTFSPRVTYGLYVRPYLVSVIAVDLDNDGDLDLAFADNNAAVVRVLLNDGSGNFVPGEGYISDLTRSVVAGDLDGDGDLDLAGISNRQAYAISVLLNSGDGGLGPATDYQVSGSPTCVVTADFDGDGDLDLAAGNRSSSSISVLLNTGDGTFAARMDYFAREGVHSLVAADFDGDDDLDLAAAGDAPAWDHFSILLNEGSGTFASPVDYAAWGGSSSVIAADIDGDGDLDVVMPRGSKNKVLVFMNTSCCRKPITGNVNCDPGEVADIGDVIEILRLLFTDIGDPFCCEDEADIDHSGIVDIGDLTRLISSLFITLNPLPACP